MLAAASATGGVLALCWTALKVGALSYGGGFVIIPLMQADAVDRHGWMTDPEFLNAVALGQVTPGPVVHTVAVVGYAAHGLGGALLATFIAFAPSFLFVLAGGPRLAALRENVHARAFLDGAGPAAIGAILGSAVPLALALTETWQFAVLAAGAVVLAVGTRRGRRHAALRRCGRDRRGAPGRAPALTCARMPDMVLDVIFGVVAIAIGLYLLVRRTTLVGIAQERGRGIRSMTTHTIIAVVLVLVGIWSLLSAFA